MREATLTDGTLNGTGSEPWAAMWESARTFSEELAYPGREFPVVEDDVRCVLCQQHISRDASDRLKRFQAFIASTTEQELRTIRDEFVRLRKVFLDLKTTSSPVEEAIDEIRIENEPVANAISSAISINENRRKAIVAALTENNDLSAECPALQSSDTAATALAEQLDERIRTLRSTSNEQEKKRVTLEAQELRARKLFAKHEVLVLNEIERKKKVAALGLRMDDTKTQAITQKSTAVTRTAVTQKLKDSFKEELGRLGFRQVEVELSEAGGTEGVLYHNLILTRAPGVQLPKVVSEGEQRCLSIAAFFAELSTADDPSGIVFDDPVSSLDYKWRESIARRLVEEAKARQVIVFTHDIAFLFLLKQFAAEQAVEQLDQHVRQIPAKGSGICAEDMPWVAMPVGKKIRFLKNEWQKVEKLFNEGHQDAYEKEAKTMYGLLREGWERGLEEVLLAGLVERFRPNVQTKQVIDVADIKEEDCRTLDAAMTKCSKWLTGHNQAAGARAAVPEPAELKADIAALETWVSTIRTRRA